MEPAMRNLDEELKAWKNRWEKISAKDFLEQAMTFYKTVHDLASLQSMPPFILSAILRAVAAEIEGSPQIGLIAGLFAQDVRQFKQYVDKNFMKKETVEEPLR